MYSTHNSQGLLCQNALASHHPEPGTGESIQPRTVITPSSATPRWAGGKQLTSQASRLSWEVLSASLAVSFTSWSQFYCFYYFNSFPSGLPYLPMQNWFRDATFGAHYIAMATRIFKVYFSSSSPFYELFFSPSPPLTTYVFCMRSKTQKTVRPLSLSDNFFLPHAFYILAQHAPDWVHEVTPSSQLPVVCGVWEQGLGSSHQLCFPLLQGTDTFLPAYINRKHAASCFSWLALKNI